MHFSEQAVVDFVRGVDARKHVELESHLASGCPQCTADVRALKLVQSVGAQESRYAPPSDVVRMIKLEFEAQKSESPATLVFDSLAQPALAGVRSAGTAAARQMVYEAEGLMVDLRFDRPSRSKCISLIGQVLDQKAPGASLANASVMLWTDNGLVLAETRTNGLGEFQLEFEAQNRLRLSIQAVAGTLIRIPLADLSSNQEGKGITNGIRGGYC